jgi:hypothetical protein
LFGPHRQRLGNAVKAIPALILAIRLRWYMDPRLFIVIAIVVSLLILRIDRLAGQPANSCQRSLAGRLDSGQSQLGIERISKSMMTDRTRIPT